MDTYYHKRDHSLLIALHNPVGTNRTSASSWNTKLHSNVGFRNYLEHVVSSIRDWVREQVTEACDEIFSRNFVGYIGHFSNYIKSFKHNISI